jgi:hypothetical protein
MAMTHNVLLTCSGSLKSLSTNADPPRTEFKVFGADTDWKAVVLPSVDTALVSPPFASEGYAGWLEGVIAHHDIRLVYFKYDEEARFFAENYATFKDRIILSDPLAVLQLSDKEGLAEELCAVGLEHWAIEHYAEPTYPCIVKPAVGAGSIGFKRVNSPEELPADLSGLIMQEVVEGTLWNVDVAYDPLGNRRLILPFRVISKVAHKTAEQVLDCDQRIMRVIETLLDSLAFRFRGQLNIEVYEVEDHATGRTSYKVMDMNLRRGLATVFWPQLGIDYWSVIAKWLDGDADPMKAITQDMINSRSGTYMAHATMPVVYKP